MARAKKITREQAIMKIFEIQLEFLKNLMFNNLCKLSDFELEYKLYEYEPFENYKIIGGDEE